MSLPILVAGSHRSGTSAIGRVIASLGIDTGPADRLIKATASNPRGHFEVRELTTFNDNLLASLGGHWLAPPRIRPNDLRKLARGPLGDLGREALDRQFGESDWFWKDPRLSLLLPFWRSVMEGLGGVVVGVRHPSAVARSLHTRDGIPESHGRWLFATHLARLARDLVETPSLVIDFDRLLTEPETVVNSVAEFLGRLGHEDLDRDGALAAIEPSLNRHPVTEDDVLPSGIDGFWAAIKEMHGHPLQQIGRAHV